MAKKAKKVDARTVRSQRELAIALESLLQEKDFIDISIKEIAEKALVSKNTFYNNFDTKEELLDRLFLRYIAHLKPEEVSNGDRSITERIDRSNTLCAQFLSEHYAKLHSMVIHDGSRSIYWSLVDRFQHIIRDELHIYDNGLTDLEHDEMESAFFAGGCAHLVYYELGKDPNLWSVQKLRELLDSLWGRLLGK